MSLLALLIAATQASPPSISLLSGYWLSCNEGVEISETWSDLRSGMLLGTSITVNRSGKLSWESARIAPSDEGYVFFANPSGQAPTRFQLKSAERNELVFENLEHDFPQRLIYRRDKDKLHARIEGMVEGKPESEEWTYRAAPLNSRCGG